MTDLDQLLADIAELTEAWAADDAPAGTIRPNEAYAEAVYPIKEW